MLPPRATAEVESSCATCRPSCQPLVRGREEQLVNIPAAARVTHGIQLLLLLRQPQLLQLPRDTCTTSLQWHIPTAEGRAQVRFFLRFFVTQPQANNPYTSQFLRGKTYSALTTQHNCDNLAQIQQSTYYR